MKIDKVITEEDCPKCGACTYRVNIDEVEFDENNIGRVHIDYACENCDNYFRVHYNFNYEVTKKY